MHNSRDDRNADGVSTALRNLRLQDSELQVMSDEGFALSMHQPWASLLVAGIKRSAGCSLSLSSSLFEYYVCFFRTVFIFQKNFHGQSVLMLVFCILSTTVQLLCSGKKHLQELAIELHVDHQDNQEI